MANIKTITQATGYIAVYAGRKKEEDRVEPVICWSVLEFEDEDEPDEVIGQIFNGNCITEANAVDEEEGYGEFVGYFKESKEGLRMAREMCEAYREKFAKLNKKAEEEEGEEDDEEDDLEEVVESLEDDEEGEGEDDEDDEDDEDEDEDEDGDEEDWEDVEDEDDDED